MKRKSVIKRKMISFSADEPIFNGVKELSEETGVSKSEISRRALKNYLEAGCNEAQFMLNFVMLTQTVNDMRGKIPEDSYEQLQQYIGNIMQIKGGK